MSFSTFFSDISNFISGANLDEDAQNIVDEVKEISENINENNNSSFNFMDEQEGGDPLQRSGQTLPTNDITPLEEMEEVDYDYGDFKEVEEDNDSSLPEDDIPIENPVDNICTNNPDSLSCEKEIVDAYFAKKGEKAVPATEVGNYTFNNPNILLKDNTEGREKVIDDILEWLVKRKLGSAYVNETTKANINTALPYEKLGKNVPISFDIYNSDTQASTSHSDIIKNSAGKYDARKKIPTEKREKTVKYIVTHIKTPSDGHKYITTKKDVEEALTKKEYAAGEVVENIKLYKVIDDYKKTIKANLASKVYLVAKTKNFKKGTTIKFKIFESGDKLLSDYVNEEQQLPFLQGTNERTEVMGTVITEDVDNPETGNILEGRVAIEIALRPKKEKPTDENDISANLEDWKKKFKKAEGETEEKEDKLYLKVSTTSYPEVEEEEFLVGEELVVKSLDCITKEMLTKICSSFSPSDDFMKYINEYAKDFNVCTPLKIAHLLAQIAHESACFTATKENLGYNKKNIRDIWGWKTIRVNGVKKRVHRETMTENGVTIKLWDDASVSKITGDSKFANWRYKYVNKQGTVVNHRGRGYIHLTWKSNYKMYTTYYQEKHNDTSLDFVETPEKLEETQYALESSFFFWNSICKKTNGVARTNVINKIIDDSKLTLRSSLANHNKIVKKVTKKINPGLKGLADRKKKFKLILNYLKDL